MKLKGAGQALYLFGLGFVAAYAVHSIGRCVGYWIRDCSFKGTIDALRMRQVEVKD